MGESGQRSAAGRPRVRVVGGGVAGLEAAMALADLAGDRIELSLIAPEPDFVLKPLVVEEPFTGQPAAHHELEPIVSGLGANLVRGALESVDTGARELRLASGERLGYDAAIVCVGARAQPAFARGETFWANRGDLDVELLLAEAERSEAKALALIAPPGTSWPLPLYELALMLRRRAEELGRDALAIRVLSPEQDPLEIFGSNASASVTELLRARRIVFEGGAVVVDAGDGTLRVGPTGNTLDAGAIVALPVLVGPHVAGLPADVNGFIRIDQRCRVVGAEGLYAAGDGTIFPVKQGGLATQQADCAAEHVAAAMGAPIEPDPFRPVLRGQLLTGMESLNMRHALGRGEASSDVSLDYLWWPPQKVSGRYLSAWLADVSPRLVTDLPPGSVEVEVAWPHEWHAEPLISEAERA